MRLSLCACHITGDYKYANSVEYLEELAAEEEKAAYQEFEHSHKGRICRNHMHYCREQKTWEFSYDPLVCVHSCHSEGYCPVRGRDLTREKEMYFMISGFRQFVKMEHCLMEKSKSL